MHCRRGRPVRVAKVKSRVAEKRQQKNVGAAPPQHYRTCN